MRTFICFAVYAYIQPSFHGLLGVVYCLWLLAAVGLAVFQDVIELDKK